MFDLLTRRTNYEPLLNDLFDDVWRTTNNFSRNLGIDLPYNMDETEKEYSLEIALPGFTKKDISIKFEDNLLFISHNSDETGEDFSWKHSFKKSFKLPNNIVSNKITAKFEDGILKVIVPKKVEATKVVNVEIK
tara:strand:+ start:740 stop:1141 length:402 start_codon:yes stop_codon:yes gene_type:complete